MHTQKLTLCQWIAGFYSNYKAAGWTRLSDIEERRAEMQGNGAKTRDRRKKATLLGLAFFSLAIFAAIPMIWTPGTRLLQANFDYAERKNLCSFIACGDQTRYV